MIGDTNDLSGIVIIKEVEFINKTTKEVVKYDNDVLDIGEGAIDNSPAFEVVFEHGGRATFKKDEWHCCVLEWRYL